MLRRELNRFAPGLRNDSASFSTVNSSRVARTLYRQLLRWCRATDSLVPLGCLVPPIHIQAPNQVERMMILAGEQRAYTVDDQRAVDRARSLLPPKTSISSSGMTVPVHSTQQLRNFFKAVFTLNANDPLQVEYQKERMSQAFEALKSLNAMSTTIQQLQTRRKEHEDRDGVTYKVGQVVRHRTERWRGVIVGWNRTSSLAITTDGLPSTSLTTKDYTGLADGVAYQVILDEGDAQMLSAASGVCKAMQSDLQLLNDGSLVRIRNKALAVLMLRFDSATNSFIPNELQAYEFPADDMKAAGHPNLPVEEVSSALSIVNGTQQFARRLERYILDETSCPAERGLVILSNVQSRLASIAAGDVFPDKKYQFSSTEPRPTTTAAMHIRSLLNLALEIQDLMSHRRNVHENREVFRYKLGDIVRHKVYGFRGVVVSCDPRPPVDVTNWDGLKHIANPMEHPFYHVIPDKRDCIEAFGGERTVRYVCQENLDFCPEDRLLIQVDLDPSWRRADSGKSFIAPADQRFRHGENTEDDVVSERCLARIEEEVNWWQLNARTQDVKDPVIGRITLRNMLVLLKKVDNIDDALPVQEMIKEMRKAHPRLELRWMLESGSNFLLSGDVAQALNEYQKVLCEDSETYAEAHNKLATCLFMMGRLEESLASTSKALAIDEDHYQALNGLGLIYFERRDYPQAVEYLRKSVVLDPWSPVSAKLSLAVDLANQAVTSSERR